MKEEKEIGKREREQRKVTKGTKKQVNDLDMESRSTSRTWNHGQKNEQRPLTQRDKWTGK